MRGARERGALYTNGEMSSPGLPIRSVYGVASRKQPPDDDAGQFDGGT